MATQRLLITGSTGLLGATAVSQTSPRYDVIACHPKGALPVSAAQSQILDVTDSCAVSEVFSTLKPTIVLHCAAKTHVDWCEHNSEETLRVNVGGTQNVSRAAEAVGALLVYISTDSVFDGHRGHYIESDEPKPVNVYARSKWLGEQAVMRESSRHLVIRTNFYGWSRMSKKSLAEWMIGKLAAKERISGFHDIVFSPLLIEDLIDRLIVMIERKARGTFHLGSADSISKFEFARAIARIFGFDETLIEAVPLAAVPSKAPRPKITSLDSSKAKRELGLNFPTVEESLHRFFEMRASRELSSFGACAPGRI